MALRLCIANFPNVFEVSEDGKFRGLFYIFFQSLTNSLEKAYGNISFTSSDKLGDLNQETQEMDGCLGRLQRNESDTHVPPVELPVLTRGVQQSFIAHASRVVIVSAYDTTYLGSETSVMDAFDSFGDAVWALVTVFNAILAVLMLSVFIIKMQTAAMRRQLIGNHIKARKVNYWTAIRQTTLVIAGNALKQYSAYDFNNRRLSARFTFFVLLMFMFLIHNYFSSLIKTDMVVQKPPHTISTYADILAKKSLKPIWVQQFTTHLSFERAGPRSPEGRIWKRAQKIGMEKCRVHGSLEAASELVSEITEQTSVALLPAYIVWPIVITGCSMSRKEEFMMNRNAWIKSDPNADEKIEGYLASSHISPERARRIRRVFQSLMEFHVMAHASAIVEETTKSTHSSSMLDCISNKIVYPDHGIAQPGVSHYKKLLQAAAGLLLIASLVLLFKKVRSKNKTPKRNRTTQAKIYDVWQLASRTRQ